MFAWLVLETCMVSPRNLDETFFMATLVNKNLGHYGPFINLKAYLRTGSICFGGIGYLRRRGLKWELRTKKIDLLALEVMNVLPWYAVMLGVLQHIGSDVHCN